MLRRAAAVAVLAAAATAVQGAGPQFWRLEGSRSFLEGEIEGLSLDSDGRLRLGLSPRPLFDPEAPNAWSVARDARGILYVGTGNDGRVVRVDGAKGTVLFDADELEVHAVAAGPDGRVYAATSPDGAVYAIDAASKATRFFDPPEKYIWALAFDASGALYVATGGEGRVYRVSPDGKSEVVLASTETHILSLRVDARGRVYAGSSPEGIVYRIDAPGRVFVLLDSAFREIKALDLGADGSLYAAAIDGRTTEPSPRPPAPAAGPPAAGAGNVVAEVTVSESYAVVPPAGGSPRRTGDREPGRRCCRPAEGRPPPDPPVRGDRHPLELDRGRPPLRRGHRRGRPRRHGEQGQGLPRRRRRPLGARGHAARRAGHRPRVRARGRRSARDVEPGAGLRPRRHARLGGDLPLEGEGHRDGLELGTRVVGRDGAARHRGARPDPRRQHGDAGHDLDRLVRAGDPPGRGGEP